MLSQNAEFGKRETRSEERFASTLVVLKRSEPGGDRVRAVLTGGASYIAAPAAPRAALPQANPGICVTASLGIAFPFYLAFGIPLLYLAKNWLY